MKGNHDKSADCVSRRNRGALQPKALATLDEKGIAQGKRKFSNPKAY
jgi:hypothetical protein